MATRKRTPLADRFARFVDHSDHPSGCWLWTGTVIAANGYGQIWSGGGDGKMISAHRAAWELSVGPIPVGLCVCHHCDTRLCVRPDHLFLGTYSDNAQDMIRKQRNQYGENHHNARLTPAHIEEIRNSTHSCEALAARFNVTFSTIARVRRRVWWKHLP